MICNHKESVMKPKTIPYLILVMLIFLTTACGGGSDPAITAESTLVEAASHMSSLAGFEFLLTHTGPIVYIDTERTTEFLQAGGNFVSPDQALTTVKVGALGLVLEITVISIGDTQWGTNPLTGAFQELSETYIYKPTQYLDPENGFFPKLGSELTELVLVGEEELEEMPGLKLQHMTANLPGEVIFEISNGLMDAGTLQVDIWLDPGTSEIHRVTLTDPSAAAEEERSVWQFDFWSFGETVEITAP